jgi:hypothetical protein
MGITFLILLTAVSQALAQTPQPAANISKAHVEGVVLDGLAGTPIADVMARISTAASPFAASCPASTECSRGKTSTMAHGKAWSF